MVWRLEDLQDEAATKVIGDSSYNELVSRLIADSGSDAPPAPMSPAGAAVGALPAEGAASSSAAAAAPPAAAAGSGAVGEQGVLIQQQSSAEAALAVDRGAGGAATRGPPLQEAEVGFHNLQESYMKTTSTCLGCRQDTCPSQRHILFCENANVSLSVNEGEAAAAWQEGSYRWIRSSVARHLMRLAR